MADTTGAQPVERAGFWPRALALFIDGCLIAGILGLIGIILFAPTGGYIRVSTALIHSDDCRAETNLRVPVPSGLTPTHAYRCTRSLLGYVFDRQVTVAQVTKSGAVTYTRSQTYAVNASGAPVQAFYLDNLSLFLFAAYLLLLEWRFGRTLGKDLMKVRVCSLGGGAITLVQSARRSLVRALPVLVAILVGVPRLLGLPFASSTGYLWTGGALILGVGLAQTINFILTTRKRTLPWHDRFAGTEAIRGR